MAMRVPAQQKAAPTASAALDFCPHCGLASASLGIPKALPAGQAAEVRPAAFVSHAGVASEAEGLSEGPFLSGPSGPVSAGGGALALKKGATPTAYEGLAFAPAAASATQAAASKGAVK